MKYDFDTVVNRRNTGSLKWDVAEHELPMWVADMDFQTAPEIIDALKKRVSHGVFGYGIIPAAWEDAYINWWEKRHHFTIERQWLTFCTGVIPAISSTVRKLTTPNEQVVIQTPVYNIFFNSILNNGCRVLENRLHFTENGYEMDFVDLEAKLSDPQTSLMILCNPQNPGGRIWKKEELARVGALAKKYHGVVIADEIHCDLTDPGTESIPFASVSEDCRDNSITCIAPTKAFNLAGLQTAAVMIPNEALHHKVWRALNTDEVAEPNAFAVTATVAAFTKGEAWLDALREYLYENKQLVKTFLEKELPALHLTPSNATYLLWLNTSDICEDGTKLAHFIRKETGLYITEGEEYGNGGKSFMRINIACPRARLEEGLQRLKTAIDHFS